MAFVEGTGRKHPKRETRMNRGPEVRMSTACQGAEGTLASGSVYMLIDAGVVGG